MSKEWMAPASFGQERLWMADQLAGEAPIYNVGTPIPLPFDVGADTVRSALAGVVRRHETLRTALRLVDGELRQVVYDEVPVELTELDLGHLPREERERRIVELYVTDVRAPFDLDTAPLWRARLIGLGEDGWCVMFAAHHSICDATSCERVSSEIVEQCRAAVEGRPPLLPDLDIQYADYAAWQRDRLSGERLAEHLTYWREALADLPVCHDLPTDRPRPAEPGYEGADLLFELSGELRAEAQRVAAAHSATPVMVFLAGFTALLHRMSGSADIVVGMPVQGRELPELAPLIGMFVNTVVVRVSTAGDPTFGELVGRVKEAMLGALDHGEVPFQRLVEEFAPDRSSGVPPLYQIGFNSLPLRAVGSGHGTAKEDLALELAGEVGRLEYSTELFDAATAQALADRYLRLLGEAVAAPGTRLSELELLDADEQERILAGFNDTAADFPADATLHGLIREQTARTPDATAVVFQDRSLTYAELDAAADRLARRLAAEGAGPESIVGVCAERSLDLIVALLAVLKSGAAYLPLDPDYPPDRLAFMLEDSAAPVVLTQPHLADRLPSGSPMMLIGDTAPADAGPAAPGVTLDPAGAAYVIYTSGSTGRPKGVVNSHRGIVNRLHWMQRYFGLTAEDRVLQKTPASFDVSVWEFFWPLLTGATLVMAEPGGHRDPAYLWDVIVARRITTVHFVPSMLAEFLAVEAVDAATPLRRIVCSGEELPADLVERADRLLPECGLFNLYGPTEAAVDVSAVRCEPGAPVTIGGPIDNIRLYVLDDALRPVPIGAPGHLHIGGVGLARGYLRRPALTAERFVPDPYGPPGSRLYATGDLARWTVEGTLRYLGRIDTQIKLRGLRIELGEIETALRDQPGVRDAAVAVRDERLVAYLTGDVDPARLRTALKDRLPDYMVPAAYLALDALPLTPSGKLDRKALPAPAPAEAVAYVAPRGTSEELVAQTWSEVLGVDRIGVHDDFFALGGHSLLAVRAISRLAAAVGMELTVHTLFSHPTVEELAAEIERLLMAELDVLSDDEAAELLSESEGNRR
ncbi:amino acid adenylation domain-containing protein [Microtetraspora sp. NBRC 16547]|uniref:non-ribosomal peptide synthetase n=1 Tax=Microtetraspora sp. NBRC 16547 TaxID=3030993 RepID=UPI0024A0A5B2|nr:amino acid adenylation domain-containing protein [Microtetraspora sp. NBRC 16547]GLX00434.1 hypothetical protein Misp02_45200 [Microtetraspora sp. NBRC 16547]